MQNAKMQKDLQLARKLQEALVKGALPKVGGDYELTAGFFPCEAVGGDIYDCTVYDDKLVMYVADVSGHGVMPAMLAVFFLARSARGLPDGQFSSLGNTQLCGKGISRPESFPIRSILRPLLR